ncbi:MAG: DMT family transporter [Acidimicrobiaceae bacterium]|nr:DMT family transporter [Acidimicrobiaceae bacterium]
MTIVLALLSSALFGCGIALQQRPAREVPDTYAGRPSLLLRALRQPQWIAGFVAETAGFGMQVLALEHGSLVVVQPIVTTALLFTLWLTAGLDGQVLGAKEWAGAVAVVAGLSAFLILANPSEKGAGTAGPLAWAVFSGCLLSTIVGLVVWGRQLTDRRRAAAFGVAAGLADASMAVLAKSFANSLNSGVGSAFRSWTPYAVAVCGVSAVMLSQTAYQAGRPTLSLPIITVVDPVVSVAIGVGLYGETMDVGGRGMVGMVLAVGLMGYGLVVLARSTLTLQREIALRHSEAH